MARFLVQSKASGRYLVPAADGGDPQWLFDLKKVGPGVVPSLEHATQLVEDWCDVDDFPQVVDLDRIGTPQDY